MFTSLSSQFIGLNLQIHLLVASLFAFWPPLETNLSACLDT